MDGMGMRVRMDKLFVDDMTFLMLSGVVGISNEHMCVTLQRGMRTERMMLRYFNTISFAMNAIWAIAKKIMYDESAISFETVMTPLL